MTNHCSDKRVERYRYKSNMPLCKGYYLKLRLESLSGSKNHKLGQSGVTRP